MDAFFPDSAQRTAWRERAQKERISERRAFWRDLPNLPARPRDAHKGTFGTALCVGGSRGMSGAIALAGAAALAVGAGLARTLAPDPILDVVAAFFPEYSTIPAPADKQGRFAASALERILEEAEKATAVAVGPGLGRSPELDALVLELFFRIPRPAVFDADALNALAQARIFDDVSASAFADRRVAAPRILTPHPGEFARLFGVKPSNERAARVAAAVDAANRLRRVLPEDAPERFGVVLLKGADSVVATSAADATASARIAINATGNANLATGGSGDVLTGAIVGLLAQGLDAESSTRVGAALHGLAAELRATICSRGATASDVLRFLPSAFDYFEDARAAISVEG